MLGMPVREEYRRYVPLLFVLPIIYVALIIWLRQTAGSFSHWYSIDPNIRYLLDALNILALDPPGNVDHPGATVQWIGAFILRIYQPFSSVEEITNAALLQSDAFLWPILVGLTVLTAAAMVVAGAAALSLEKGLLPAVLIQLAPFLSRILVKNSMDVKPVPLLIASVLLTAALVFIALRPGVLERHQKGFIWGFGLVGGFSVATKITALPILVLPVFLLWGRRPLFQYGLACVVGFVVFAFPTLFQFDLFTQWIFKVAMGSGAYGGGDLPVVDFSVYPSSLYKLLSRPITFVPIALALITVAVTIWRKNRVAAYPSLELKALMGTTFAQFAQIALMAKHPSAHYIVSAIALSGLSIGLTYLVLRRLEIGGAGVRRWSFGLFCVLVLALMVSRVPSSLKVHREMTEKKSLALALDDSRFDQCLRVYGVFASSKSFAMMYGNLLVGEKFSAHLRDLLPENDVAYLGFRNQIRNGAGPVDLKVMASQYSCYYGRASKEHGRPASIEAVLRKIVPSHQKIGSSCSNKYETVFTAGVDCQGRPLD